MKDNKSAYSFTPEPLPDIGRSKKTPPLPADQTKSSSLVDTDLRRKPPIRDQTPEYQKSVASLIQNFHDTQSTTLARPKPRISWPFPLPSSEPTDLQKYINRPQRRHGLIQANVDISKKNLLPPPPKKPTPKTPKHFLAFTRVIKKIDQNIIPEKKTIQTPSPPKPTTPKPNQAHGKKYSKKISNISNSPKNRFKGSEEVSRISNEDVIDTKRHRKVRRWLTKNSRKLTGEAYDKF